MEYSVDKWYHLIENWKAYSLNNEEYFPSTKYTLIPYSKEINLKHLFPGEYFFKLSTRSPKDILEKKIKIKERDHRTIKLEKKIQQLEILKVKSEDDVYYLLKHSKRIKEDMESTTEQLYLVFQPWRPSLGTAVEYRCFINNSKLVGICLYKPEFYSTLSYIPVEMISFFVTQLLSRISYERFVVDVYCKDDRVYFIEINPFDEDTDTFSFNYEEITNAKHLIVKL